jgi:hypothetical protein
VFPGCPDLSIHGFTLEGPTVQNADDTCVCLRGVDGFRLTGTHYVDNAVIESNVVKEDNLPNPFPIPPPFFDDLQLLPSGTGILNVGGDGIIIRNNVVTGNDTVGIGMIDNPFGFGPPDGTEVRSNTAKKNGLNPDPRAGGLAGDLLYDGL